MMKRFASKLRGEALETRRLLAVDLVSEFSGLPSEFVVGERVDFVLDVRNAGEHAAIDARIESVFPTNLGSIEWSRSAVFSPIVDLDRRNARDGVSLAGVGQVAGDLNGDGYGDLLIGTPAFQHARSSNAVSIVFGGSLPEDRSTFELTQNYVENLSTVQASSEDAALSFGTLGDVNGDGLDDIWLRQSKSEMRILFGREGLDDFSSPELTQLVWESGAVVESGAEQLGLDPKPLGDINADGHNDFLVSFGRAAQVLFGGPHWQEQTRVVVEELDGTNGFQLPLGERFNLRDLYRFQFETTDFNLDGTLDFVMLGLDGLIGVEFGGPNVGRGGVVSEDELGTNNGFRLSIPERLRLPGYPATTISSLGDINDDGAPDFGISSLTCRETCEPFGSRSYLLLGGNELAQLQGSTVDVTTLSSETAVFVFDNIHSGGDINNDGVGDLYITSWEPEAQVIFGRHDIAERLVGNANSLMLNGFDGFRTQRETRFSSVSAVPMFESDYLLASSTDFNGDGLQDLILTETPYVATHIVFGRETSSGASAIVETLDLPAGGMVRYALNATVTSGEDQLVSLTAQANTCVPSLSDQELVSTHVTSSLHPTAANTAIHHVEVSNQAEHAVAVTVGINLNDEGVTSWQRNSLLAQEINIGDLNRDAGYGGYQIHSGNSFAKIINDLDGNGTDAIAEEGYLRGYFRIREDTHLEQSKNTHGGNRDPGWYVLGVGDFNGDGFGDFGWRDGISFGPLKHEPRSEVIYDLELQQTLLIAAGGDYNGDGLGDVWGFDRATSLPNLIFGRSGTETIRRESMSRFEGTSLYPRQSQGGDFNGDGFDDMLMAEAGQVVIVFGRADMGTAQTLRLEQEDIVRLGPLTGNPANSPPNHGVFYAGDLNGDGFDDVVVNNNRIVFGSEGVAGLEINLNSPDERSKVVPVSGDKEFVSVRPAGDFNGDGLSDLVFVVEGPSPYDAPGFQRFDRTGHLLFGARDLADRVSIDPTPVDGSRDVRISTALGQLEQFSGGGDIDGDGMDDLVIMANHHRGRQIDNGIINVIFGRSTTARGDSGSIRERLDLPVGGSIVYDIESRLANPTFELPLDVSASACTTNQEDTAKENNVANLFVQVLPRPGDFDRDGQVTYEDFLILSRNFGRQEASASQGDANGDKRVGFADFLILSGRFGT